jgi:predicted RNase H-like HicB family nuclease
VTTYAVVVERADDGGYGAWSPDLPGVVAVAETEADVLAETRRAIELHLEGLLADGQPIPRPATVAATVVTLSAA